MLDSQEKYIFLSKLSKLDQSYPLAMKHGLLDNPPFSSMISRPALVFRGVGSPGFLGPRLLSQVKRGWERTKSGLEFYTSGLQLLWQDGAKKNGTGGHCIAV